MLEESPLTPKPREVPPDRGRQKELKKAFKRGAATDPGFSVEKRDRLNAEELASLIRDIETAPSLQEGRDMLELFKSQMRPEVYQRLQDEIKAKEEAGKTTAESTTTRKEPGLRGPGVENERGKPEVIKEKRDDAAQKSVPPPPEELTDRQSQTIHGAGEVWKEYGQEEKVEDVAARRVLGELTLKLSFQVQILDGVTSIEEFAQAVRAGSESGELNDEDPAIKDLFRQLSEGERAPKILRDELKSKLSALNAISISSAPREAFEHAIQTGGGLDTYFTLEQKLALLAKIDQEADELVVESLLESPPEGEVSRWLAERNMSIAREREKVREAFEWVKTQRRRISTKTGRKEFFGPKTETKLKKAAPAKELRTKPEDETLDAEKEREHRKFLEDLRKNPTKLDELERQHSSAIVDEWRREIKLLAWAELVQTRIEEVGSTKKLKLQEIATSWSGNPELGLVGLSGVFRKMSEGPKVGFHLNADTVTKLEQVLHWLKEVKDLDKEITELARLQREEPSGETKIRPAEKRQPLLVSIGQENKWKLERALALLSGGENDEQTKKAILTTLDWLRQQYKKRKPPEFLSDAGERLERIEKRFEKTERALGHLSSQNTKTELRKAATISYLDWLINAIVEEDFGVPWMGENAKDMKAESDAIRGLHMIKTLIKEGKTLQRALGVIHKTGLLNNEGVLFITKEADEINQRSHE